MPTFLSYDGARLSFRAWGEGEPLLVVPGGPGRDADYLGDLGGIAELAGRTLFVFEPRGTGASPAPDDPVAYALGGLADDLEALRVHLVASGVTARAADPAQRNVAAGQAFWDRVPDPFATRDALSALSAPVRIVIGELDLVPGPFLAAELAAVFPDARILVQPGGGHFPWVDDAALFARLVSDALTDADRPVAGRG